MHPTTYQLGALSKREFIVSKVIFEFNDFQKKLRETTIFLRLTDFFRIISLSLYDCNVVGILSGGRFLPNLS